MGKFVTPEVYFIGHTCMDMEGMSQYLTASESTDFWELVYEARRQGLNDGEILISFYAKLCYASHTLGKNENVTQIRGIPENLRNCWDQGHGSVFEHVTLNFVIRNCSRVLTHELVRHRAGTAFSQTSGRYVRGDCVNLVFDPILEPVREEALELQALIEDRYGKMVAKMGLNEMKDFGRKKKITSALRRFLPNGQSNEIGFSANLRAIRHIMQLRTSRGAEWEIRECFGQIYRLIKYRYPLLFYGAKEEIVDGLLEVSGMKMQPYE